MKQLVYCDDCGIVKANLGEVQTQPGDMCGVFVEQDNMPEDASYCGGTLKLLVKEGECEHDFSVKGQPASQAEECKKCGVKYSE